MNRLLMGLTVVIALLACCSLAVACDNCDKLPPLSNVVPLPPGQIGTLSTTVPSPTIVAPSTTQTFATTTMVPQARTVIDMVPQTTLTTVVNQPVVTTLATTSVLDNSSVLLAGCGSGSCARVRLLPRVFRPRAVTKTRTVVRNL